MEDLINRSLKVVVTEGLGSLQHRAPLWEDVAGRKGKTGGRCAKLRRNIVAFEQGSGAAWAFTHQQADAWITWVHGP